MFKIIWPTFNATLTLMTNNHIKDYWRMIICLVYKTIYRRFIATDTYKITASKRNFSDRFLFSECARWTPCFTFTAHQGAEKLTAWLTRDKIQITPRPRPLQYTNTHTNTPLLSCILHDHKACEPCGLKWKKKGSKSEKLQITLSSNNH